MLIIKDLIANNYLIVPILHAFLKKEGGSPLLVSSPPEMWSIS
jgi:hypothetical protein